ncbi:hypothetical protein SDC9_130200 [bioreactor metagenome]|uniref:Uncharacterized protein n=1 Tax=bioreactor metagenome TaxID=1076179 RepID=A0A645D1N2_9ZZZZ
MLQRIAVRGLGLEQSLVMHHLSADLVQLVVYRKHIVSGAHFMQLGGQSVDFIDQSFAAALDGHQDFRQIAPDQLLVIIDEDFGERVRDLGRNFRRFRGGRNINVVGIALRQPHFNHVEQLSRSHVQIEPFDRSRKIAPALEHVENDRKLDRPVLFGNAAAAHRLQFMAKQRTGRFKPERHKQRHRQPHHQSAGKRQRRQQNPIVPHRQQPQPVVAFEQPENLAERPFLRHT